MTRVCVVVPTFERPARLPGLVASLEAQTLPVSDFDVIISDDGSRDETPQVLAEIAARSRLRLRVVRGERNQGPGAARNRAWRASDAPVIAFTDDDCLATPGWLEAGLRALEDPSIGIVQGRTIPDPTAENRGWSKTVKIERFSKKYESCNIFYRTEVLREVDGFDEQIVFFGEDVVPGWNARRRGVEPTFADDALVHHEVTYPGFRFWWRFAMLHENWASLARRFPEMRRDFFWCGIFLGRRHAAFLSALAGIAVGASLWWPAYALAAPYLGLVLPRRLRRREILTQLSEVAFDAAVVAGMLKGSIRERTLVL